jgi:hypothetical protein
MNKIKVLEILAIIYYFYTDFWEYTFVILFYPFSDIAL